MASPLPVSLCMIVRDEADVLPGCLASVRGLSLQLIGGGIKTVEGHSWDATAEAAFSALAAL